MAWSHINIHRVPNGKITDVWYNFAGADSWPQVSYQLVPPTQVSAACRPDLCDIRLKINQ